jgi:cytochrome c peroxidase
MRGKRLALASAIALALVGVSVAEADEDLRSRALQQFQPLPLQRVALPDNPVTPARVTLGKDLFFDPRLSATGVISCNACHNLGMGGADHLATAVSHGWAKGSRNVPTVLNAVLNTAHFWDGSTEQLKEQAKGPEQAALELVNKPQMIVVTLSSMPGYVEKFRAAFPGEKKPVTLANAAKALQAFEATLVTPDSPFDRWLRGEGDAALDPEQKKGLALFMDKGCSSCHKGVNLGGEGYFPFGVVRRPGVAVLPPDHEDRFAVSKTASESYLFRAAPLRNVALTAPYFHSGQVWDLRRAVAIMGSSQLGIELSDAQEDAITAFLGSLTGRQPRVEYPVLPASSAGTPRPHL